MTTLNVDASWKSLYRAGGIAALLAGAFAIIDAILQAIIHPALVTYTKNTLANTSNSFLTTDQFLLFVWNNAILYRAWYFSFALVAIFALPAFLALYVSLGNRDKGSALIGSAIGIAGVGVILANVADHFFLVDEAITYQNGCTPCATAALAGAAATGSVNTADLVGAVLVALAVIILSLVMLRGPIFDRRHGSLGLVAGFYTMIGGIISGFSGDIFYYSGLVLYFLLAIWFFAVGLKLYDLR